MTTASSLAVLLILTFASPALTAPPEDISGKQREQGKAIPPNAGQAVGAPIDIGNTSITIEKPCIRGQDNRTSDLCAQWKAADAAAASALWTARSFWLGLGGLLVGFFTLMAAAAAAVYARRAAAEAAKSAQASLDAVRASSEANKLAEREYKWARKEAKTGAASTELALATSRQLAESAHRHAEIVADNARKQLRAYIFVDEIVVTEFGPNRTPVFFAKILNHGQTPARDVRISAKVDVQYADRGMQKVKLGIGRSALGSSGTLGHDKSFSFNRSTLLPLSPDDCSKIFNGEMCCLFSGVVSYKDIFGDRHLTLFKWSYEINPARNDMHLVATERHNIGN